MDDQLPSLGWAVPKGRGGLLEVVSSEHPGVVPWQAIKESVASWGRDKSYSDVGRIQIKQKPSWVRGQQVQHAELIRAKLAPAFYRAHKIW